MQTSEFVVKGLSLYIMYALIMYLITYFYFYMRRRNHGITDENFPKEGYHRQDYFMDGQRLFYIISFMLPILGWISAVVIISLLLYEICLFLISVDVVKY